MERWEAALHRFIQEWKDREDVAGILVCGSYVTGHPTPHSDIDLHIILTDDTDWRERGNRIIDGFLIEYFANPTHQFKHYFQDDNAANRKDAANQLVTGRILLDKDGTVSRLKAEASEWLSKPFPPMSDTSIHLAKYGLWDNLDNLQDACEQGSADCVFIYHHTLYRVYETYARFLGQPIIHFSKLIKCFDHPERARQKYNMESFTDQEFTELFLQSFTQKSPPEMVRYGTELTWHVLNALGGFEVDGWRFKSPSQRD